METTVDLDDDLYDLASAYAAARDITLGAAICELVRQSQPSTQPSRMVSADNGLPFFPSTGRILTPEMVKAALEDEIG